MQVRVGRRRVGLLLASSSVAALLVGGGSDPARAACTVVTGASAGFTNPAGNTIGCVTVQNANVTGSIINAGTIIPAATPNGIHITTGATIAGGVVNSGTITSGAVGIYQENGTIAGGVGNSGTISVQDTGILLGSITAGASFSGGISNSGTITVSSGSFEAIRIGGNSGYGFASFAGGINNSRTISGGNTGIVVLFVSAFSGGISNSGTISAAGFGIGIGFSCAQAQCPGGSVTSFSGGITNSGSISAPVGILVQDVSAFSGNIVNSGSIGEIEVTGTTSFAGVIANAGTIAGNGGIAIDVSGAQTAMTINQTAGSIDGDIKLSSHADVLNITGGAISGNIIGAGSSNTVNFAPGAGNTFTYGPGFGVSGVNQININSGTVILDGANSATNVDVNGGTLAGTGTIDPAAVTIHAGATFAPGTPGVPGSSMAITGNIVFQPGATYAVSLNPATASFATISGTATLAGNVTAAFAAGSYLAKQYMILQSGGLNGTFTGLVSTSLPTGFSATLAYNADDVFLDLFAAGSISGLNVNQENVANAVLGAFNNGASLPPGFVSVLGLSGANQANAFSALSGQNSAGFLQGAFQAGNSFLTLMVNPFLDGRFGSGFGPANGFASEEPPPRAAAVFASAMPMKAPPPTFDQRFSAWGGAYGGSGRVTGDPFVGSSTTTASVAAFAAGIDYRATPDTIYGLALAGGATNWGLDAGLGGGHSDMFQAGLYGTQRSGNAYLSGALAYNFHDVTTNRTVTIAGTDMLQGRLQANGVGARLESGYRYALPWLGITPYAAAQVQSIALPSYGETATSGSSQFALNFASQTATTTRTELGTWLDKSELLGNGARMTLYGRLAWAHDFGDTPSASAIFQALPGSNFIVNGAAPARDGGLVTGGAKYDLMNGWSVAAKFDGEFSSTTSIYSGTGVVRKTW